MTSPLMRPEPQASLADQNTPGLSPLNLLRLSLFQGCLGCLAVVFAGMLNRVMISELAFPALLVGGGLAFEQLMSPSRVLFGHISDTWPIRGRRRTPYIWLGTAGFCLMAVLSIPVIFWTEQVLREGNWLSITTCSIALCGLFALYGLAISISTTPYLALVIDLTTEKERPRAVGVIWCMLTIGIIVGAISISFATKGLDGISDPILLQPALQKFMIWVVAFVFCISIFACWGMESKKPLPEDVLAAKRWERFRGYQKNTLVDVIMPDRAKQEFNDSELQKEVGLMQAWSIVTSSRQVIIFFIFLSLYTLGLFLQDPILESYGAEVFSLPIHQTTLLNAYWGVGTLIGLLLAGLWITPRLGKLETARMGCWMIFATLLLLMATGLTANVKGLYFVMVLFGLAAGIATNSALVLMLDLTLPEMAGTFVGVWGLAQALSRAMGKVLGGGLLDLGRVLSGPDNPLLAFSFVFTLESILMILAIVVLSNLNIRSFRHDTITKIETLLMADLD